MWQIIKQVKDSAISNSWHRVLIDINLPLMMCSFRGDSTERVLEVLTNIFTQVDEVQIKDHRNLFVWSIDLVGDEIHLINSLLKHNEKTIAIVKLIPEL